MNFQSPKFKIEEMAPLSQNQKVLIEDEPLDDVNEINITKISFNENLIVCNYRPWQTVIQIQKTIQKLKEYENVYWINPILKEGQKIPTKSILKNCNMQKSNLNLIS